MEMTEACCSRILFFAVESVTMLSNNGVMAREPNSLLRVVRTQGTGDEAYAAVYECQDANGEHGVRLDRIL